MLWASGPTITAISERRERRMIRAMTTLLIFQLMGEVTVIALALPIPGPVLGMLLLLLALVIRGSTPRPLKETAHGLLTHLSLLFVPAGVGVMAHVSLIQSEWLPILATIVLSTLITMYGGHCRYDALAYGSSQTVGKTQRVTGSWNEAYPTYGSI